MSYLFTWICTNSTEFKLTKNMEIKKTKDKTQEIQNNKVWGGTRALSWAVTRHGSCLPLPAVQNLALTSLSHEYRWPLFQLRMYTWSKRDVQNLFILYIFQPIQHIFFFKQTYQHSASLFQTVQHMPFFSYARELMSTLCHLLEFISSPPRCQCLCRVGRRHNTSSISLSQLTSTFQHSLLNTTTRIEIHSPSRWRVSVHYRQKTKRKIKKSFSSFQASLPFLGRRCHTNAVTQYLHATNITKDLYLLVNHFIHERSGESPVYGLYLTSSNPQMCSFASVSVCIYACILIIYLYMW